MTDADIRRLAYVRRLARTGAARAIRVEAGLGLCETARAVGVSPSTLSRWERAQSAPRPAPALRWAGILEGLGA